MCLFSGVVHVGNAGMLWKPERRLFWPCPGKWESEEPSLQVCLWRETLQISQGLQFTAKLQNQFFLCFSVWTLTTKSSKDVWKWRGITVSRKSLPWKQLISHCTCIPHIAPTLFLRVTSTCMIVSSCCLLMLGDARKQHFDTAVCLYLFKRDLLRPSHLHFKLTCFIAAPMVDYNCSNKAIEKTLMEIEQIAQATACDIRYRPPGQCTE